MEERKKFCRSLWNLKVSCYFNFLVAVFFQPGLFEPCPRTKLLTKLKRVHQAIFLVAGFNLVLTVDKNLDLFLLLSKFRIQSAPRTTGVVSEEISFVFFKKPTIENLKNTRGGYLCD